jgi:hypothetical protein
MRRLVAVLAIAGGAMAMAPLAATPAAAEVQYPWCAQYSGGAEGSGATNCGFTTWQQCWDTVAGGRVGDCFQNPAYQGVTAPQRPHKKRHVRVYPG